MDDTQEQNPYAPPVSSGPRLSPSLSIALGIILLVVIGATFWLNASLGIGVVLVAIPAYVRAVRLSSVRAEMGEQLSNANRIFGFLGSVGVVVGCAIAGAIAFFGTCTGMLMTGIINIEAGWMITVLLSVVGFLFAAGLLFRVAWPARRRPPAD